MNTFANDEFEKADGDLGHEWSPLANGLKIRCDDGFDAWVRLEVQEPGPCDMFPMKIPGYVRAQLKVGDIIEVTWGSSQMERWYINDIDAQQVRAEDDPT